MAEEEKELEQLILIRVMRLNARILGVVFGVVAGLGLFVATNWLVVKGGDVVGPHLGLLSQYFPGYRVTFLGSLVGFLYAMAVGFAVGFVLAVVYNWIAELREPTASSP